MSTTTAFAALGDLCARHDHWIELAQGTHCPERDDGDFRFYTLVIEIWGRAGLLTGLEVPASSSIEREAGRLLEVIQRELDQA
jgi:hypothetical protein